MAAGLLCLVGCLHPVAEKVDATVCDLASTPWDLQPIEHAALPPEETTPQKTEKPSGPKELAPRPEEAEKIPHRLTVPDELLPGGKVPNIVLPRLPNDNDPQRREKEEERRKAVQRLFPSLPPLGEDLPDPLGPEGRPLTLADLQKLAMANSPLIRQAVARVKEAQGNAIQVAQPDHRV
jgi:cobalt-zinc-cadmium efflux system outer membrane protein